MKQLTTTLSLSFLFFSGSLFSQDIITLKNGEEVKSKVTEVNSTEVKYKKHSNLEGPTYSANKSDIFMIKYENGEKEVLGTVNAKSGAANSLTEPSKTSNIDESKFLYVQGGFFEGHKMLTKREFQDKLKTNSKAYNQYLVSKQLGTIGVIVDCISIVASVRLLTDKEMTFSEKRTTRILSWGGIAVGLGFTFAQSAKVRNAVETYNSSLKTSTRLSVSENGVGLALHF